MLLTVTDKATGAVLVQRATAVSGATDLCCVHLAPPANANAGDTTADKQKHAPKGGKSATAGGAAVPAADAPSPVIVEAVIIGTAESGAPVPASWCSAKPYYFNPATIATTANNAGGATNGGATSSAVVASGVHWSLDIAAPGEVSLSHDCTELQAHAAIVASWEAADPGRSEKATVLYEQATACGALDFGTPAVIRQQGSFWPLDLATAKFRLTKPARGEDEATWLAARAAALGTDAAAEGERQKARAALAAETLAAIVKIVALAPGELLPELTAAVLEANAKV